MSPPTKDSDFIFHPMTDITDREPSHFTVRAKDVERFALPTENMVKWRKILRQLGLDNRYRLRRSKNSQKYIKLEHKYYERMCDCSFHDEDSDYGEYEYCELSSLRAKFEHCLTSTEETLDSTLQLFFYFLFQIEN